jgi:GTPase SAR1 family protein
LLKNTDTKVIIMLVGNKRDRRDRVITYNQAMDFAKKRNFGYVEVSAKNRLGIKMCFERMVLEIYKF